MEKDIFYTEIKKALQTPEEIDDNVLLEEIPEYDSMGKLILLSFIDENFEHLLSTAELNNFKTPLELWSFLQEKK